MRTLRTAVILVLAIALPAAVLVAVLQDSLEVYKRGDDATALEKLRALVEQGDTDAQLRLGIMYAKGTGVPQDFAEAVNWYRLAAEKGDADTT